jgi:hypothetical protein
MSVLQPVHKILCVVVSECLIVKSHCTSHFISRMESVNGVVACCGGDMARPASLSALIRAPNAKFLSQASRRVPIKTFVHFQWFMQPTAPTNGGHVWLHMGRFESYPNR